MDVNEFRFNKNTQIDFSSTSIKIDEKFIKDIFSVDNKTSLKLYNLFNIFDTQKEDGSAGKDGILSGEGVLREYAAFILDPKNIFEVPETTIVEVVHPFFNNTECDDEDNLNYAKLNLNNDYYRYHYYL